MKLGHKISIVVSGLIILINILLSIGSYFAQKAQMVDSTSINFEVIKGSTERRLNSWFGLQSKIFTVFDEISEMTQDDAILHFDTAVRSSDFDALFAGTSTGGFYGNSTVMDAVGRDFDPRLRPWFEMGVTLEEGDVQMLNPYRDKVSGDYVLTLVKKITSNGKTFIVGGDLSLSILEELEEELTTDSIEIVLVGGDLTILSHKYNELEGLRLDEVYDNIGLEDLQDLDRRGDREFIDDLESYVYEDQEYFISAEFLGNIGWYLLIFKHTDQYYENIWIIIQSSVAQLAFLTMIVIVTMLFFLRKVLQPLHDSSETIGQLVEGGGDLSHRFEIESTDEIAEFLNRLNVFLEKFQSIIMNISNLGQEVNTESKSFIAVAESSQEKLAGQKSAITQIAAAIHQMSATAVEVATNAESTAEATLSSREYCDHGEKVILNNQESITNLATEIDSTSKVMSALEEDTQNINVILETIQDIAEQTNLLALNAAIEAARAGEQGRGFAVVADEVRVLSQKTHGSTDEIREMIETLLSNTENAIKMMQESLSYARKSVEEANKATKALQSINQSIAKISDMSRQIASAAEEQRAVTEEISRNVQSVDASANEMVAGANSVVEMSNDLHTVSESLNQNVQQFKT